MRSLSTLSRLAEARAGLTSWCDAVDVAEQLALGHTWVTHEEDVDATWRGMTTGA